MQKDSFFMRIYNTLLNVIYGMKNVYKNFIQYITAFYYLYMMKVDIMFLEVRDKKMFKIQI